MFPAGRLGCREATELGWAGPPGAAHPLSPWECGFQASRLIPNPKSGGEVRRTKGTLDAAGRKLPAKQWSGPPARWGQEPGPSTVGEA